MSCSHADSRIILLISKILLNPFLSRLVVPYFNWSQRYLITKTVVLIRDGRPQVLFFFDGKYCIIFSNSRLISSLQGCFFLSLCPSLLNVGYQRVDSWNKHVFFLSVRARWWAFYMVRRSLSASSAPRSAFNRPMPWRLGCAKLSSSHKVNILPRHNVTELPPLLSWWRGGSAQKVERATSRQGVMDSIPFRKPTPYRLGVCQYTIMWPAETEVMVSLLCICVAGRKMSDVSFGTWPWDRLC